MKNLKSKTFYLKNFSEKRRILKRYLLENYEVGDIILCFEDREIVDPGFLHKKTEPLKKIKSITVEKIYKILGKKKDKILIYGDNDRKIWTTPTRFLGSRMLRKMKLEQLNKKNKLTKLYTE